LNYSLVYANLKISLNKPLIINLNIMFNKEQPSIGNKDAETIIGQSIKVKGNFHGQGNIIVEGQVEGSIKTAGHLYVGNKAIITADVAAKEAKIGGEINGNITVQGYLEILATARINGDVQAAEISIERGAKINGQYQMSLAKDHKTGERKHINE
jgi:cytoskeletal protein CcmA (bactofilin family)